MEVTNEKKKSVENEGYDYLLLIDKDYYNFEVLI